MAKADAQESSSAAVTVESPAASPPARPFESIAAPGAAGAEAYATVTSGGGASGATARSASVGDVVLGALRGLGNAMLAAAKDGLVESVTGIEVGKWRGVLDVYRATREEGIWGYLDAVNPFSPLVDRAFETYELAAKGDLPGAAEVAAPLVASLVAGAIAGAKATGGSPQKSVPSVAAAAEGEDWNARGGVDFSKSSALHPAHRVGSFFGERSINDDDDYGSDNATRIEPGSRAHRAARPPGRDLVSTVERRERNLEPSATPARHGPRARRRIPRSGLEQTSVLSIQEARLRIPKELGRRQAEALRDRHHRR
jgi:hypothetical protein